MVSREYSRGASTQHGKEHGNDCRRAVSRQPLVVSHEPSGKTLYERVRRGSSRRDPQLSPFSSLSASCARRVLL